jgi:hypothetical protein
MNTPFFLLVLFCLLAGVAAAVLWPRRRSQEARAFIVVALATAAIAALVKAWKKSAPLR